jgi:hypothetical protein
VSLDQGGATASSKDEPGEVDTMKGSKSIPSFGSVRESITSKFAAFQVATPEQGHVKEVAREPEHEVNPARPNLEQRETDSEVLAKYVVMDEATSTSRSIKVEEDADGDPLGVTAGSKVPEAAAGRMDFAAFARGSAYSDR